GRKPYEKTFIPGAGSFLGGLLGFRVDYGIRRVCRPVNVKGAHFSGVKRPRAAAAEDSKLIAGLIDGTIAVNSLRKGERRTARFCRSDEFRSGTRAETGKMLGIVPGRNNLQHAQSIFSIRYKGKGAAGDHADFHVVHVVELPFGAVGLIEFG